MATQKKTLVIDLGMQSLRIAEFSASTNGQLTLHRGARRELLIDPAQDTTRPEQIRHALQDILKDWKIKRSDVVCVLPAHSVFTRVIQLEVPGGLSSKVDDIVKFEAQQNIPFPLKEVVWDYVLMGTTPSGALKVAFVAVKTDLLESLCEAVSSTGLKITSITIAPMALHDAFRYSVADSLITTTLLLDIGSRTTNMVIASSGNYFSRSIPSGGLSVTMAIAKEIHVELEEAELLKTSRGSVGLGAGFEQPIDPVEANIARIARQSLLKTQADISRSLSYYRSNLGGEDPAGILITGGMASMPYLAEFIQEKLQKPVGFWNVTLEADRKKKGLAVEAAEFVSANPNNCGELIGGALALTSAPRTKINLLPPSIFKKRAFSKRLPCLIASLVLFLTSLAGWYGYALQASAVTREETTKVSSSISEATRISARIQNLILRHAAIEQTGSDLLSVIRLREAYPMILAELGAKVPARFLWITEIQPAVDSPQRGVSPKSNDGSVKAILVKGLYLDNPKQASVIDDFVTSLQSSDVFVVEEKEKSKIIIQRGSPNGESWAYPFSLRIPLRNPVTPLP